MKFTAKKLVPAIILTVASTIAFSAQAALLPDHDVYSYSTSFNNRATESFSTSWNTATNVLSLSSMFNNDYGKVDNIRFTLTDGAAPDRARQYFSYNLDLVNNKVTVGDLWNGGKEIASFDNIIDIKDGKLSLKLDHSSFDKKYNVGFGNNLGVWHYVYSKGKQIDQLDLNNVGTRVDRVIVDPPAVIEPPVTGVSVSEPGTLALMGLGLLGMVGRRKLTKK